eukprot:COSAG02_NODE_719_length_18061_cov_31.886594_8_plen_115_part_00
MQFPKECREFIYKYCAEESENISVSNIELFGGLLGALPMAPPPGAGDGDGDGDGDGPSDHAIGVEGEQEDMRRGAELGRGGGAGEGAMVGGDAVASATPLGDDGGREVAQARHR